MQHKGRDQHSLAFPHGLLYVVMTEVNPEAYKEEEHPSEVFHKICVPHYILCWLANYSMLDCCLGK